MRRKVPGNGLRIDYLYEFGVFAQHLNVSRAAGELDMSPSALSKHIAEIEEALGLALVERKQKMRLTPAGHVVSDYFVEFLGGYCSAVERAAKLQEQRRLTLRMEESPVSAECADVYSMVYSFINGYDQPIHLELVSLHDATVEDAIAADELDLALHFDVGDVGELVQKADDLDMGLFYLGDDPLMVWGRADNPALAGRRSVTTDVLGRLRVMAPSRTCWRNSTIGCYEKLFSACGITLNYDLRSSNRFLEFVMLNPGESVYLLPEGTLRDPVFQGRSDMMQLPIDNELFHQRKFLAYSLRGDNPTVEALVDYFGEHWKPETA